MLVTAKSRLHLAKKGDEGLLFATGDTFLGFFTVAPVDLSGKTLIITAATEDGKTIVLGTPAKESANITKSIFALYTTSASATPVATLDDVEYSSLFE